MAARLDLPWMFTNYPGEPPLTFQEEEMARDQYASWVAASRDLGHRRDRIPVASSLPRGPFVDFLSNEPGIIMCKRHPPPVTMPRIDPSSDGPRTREGAPLVVDPFDVACPNHGKERSHPCGFLDGDAVACHYRIMRARAEASR